MCWSQKYQHIKQRLNNILIKMTTNNRRRVFEEGKLCGPRLTVVPVFTSLWGHSSSAVKEQLSQHFSHKV